MSRIGFQKGFGMIEIMVGMLIGLIASIIMFQALSVSENQKRTTTGGADAQSNGAISLFSIERDVKMAGWGLQGSVFAQCETFFTYDSETGDAIDSSPTPGSTLIKVLTITDGGIQPDTITVKHYDNPSNQDFRFAISTIEMAQASAGADFLLTSVRSCAVGNLLIASDKDKKSCTLAQVTAVDVTAKSVTHASGARYNAPAAMLTAWPTYPANANVQCIPGFFKRSYSIDTSTYQLQLTEDKGIVGVPPDVFAVSPQIMDLQAEYGIDKDDGTPGTQWVAATGDWANPTLANIRRIKAARVAVLARSGTYEKPEGGGTCTTTTTTSGFSTWANFDSSNYPSDWNCYRYKAYEINVPLRNVILSRTGLPS